MSTSLYSGELIKVTLESGIAELQLDGASVNVFNTATVNEFGQAIAALQEATGIKGLLISSTKSVFVVGADITEFTQTFGLPKSELKAHFGILNGHLKTLESLAFPSVVAINGYALGGGFELCLACDYRVMSTAAKVGLPETGLGIIPAWGGTVRLARIADFGAATAWVASGKHQSAEVALAAGAVDVIALPEQIHEEAMSLLNHAINSSEEYQQRRAAKLAPVAITLDEAQAAADISCAKVLKVLGKQDAPKASVELLVKASQENYSNALEMEADCFCDLAAGYQARALVGNFLNDQYLSKVAKTYAKQSNLAIDKAAVIGAGIMGGGIAYQNAMRDIPVVMKDINQDALDLGISEAEKLLNKKVASGRLTEEEREEILNKIEPTLGMEALADTDIIVEAVVENINVKQKVLPELEAAVKEQSILVSNTSTIKINLLAESVKRPENFAGLHFFNPVHAMPLVEVIRGDKTSDATISALVDYTLRLGKKPVVVNDCPGFLVNRVLFPYFRGFEQLILDGADFQQVDRVMEAWGWPMGPAYLGDVVGIDTLDHCLEIVAQDFPDRMLQLKNSPINQLYSSNCYGQKNGRGFYNYTKNEKGRPVKTASEDTINMLAQSAQKQVEFSDDDIVMRCMLPMAIEMARCLEEGIVASPAEADMALLYGLGFPNFRGGVVRWMNEMGLPALCKASQKFASLGKIYQVTDTMKQMAAEGKTYY